ncbi:serpin family protein [Cytobacillus horneckiae]|uniref:Serpin domain-containing protein n=1 Tax=Cytobacillus horneckiae TaxID=549687 RepID=A0A2N0ZEW5_9BACI|nr:serpin family protein [Cytobacillus horneckiae]MCM3176814.1 serpin family protein [Cytobacillus horneckiae]MEC1156656.1 serpin family protein [Cytobacillus horneckiae]MED2939123.1 serpin family protein [Cytobacillus horneckiae]PKG28061.1 hypothetical protein CWS20_15795 [Cytobacillus horneckiae]
MKRWIGVIFLTGTFLTGCGASGSEGGAETPVQFGEEDYKELLSANNQLGMEMFSEVERDENGNVFISPASLSMALSMLYNGAEGETKKEIANVLQVNGLDVKELNEANASLIDKLQKDSALIQLDIANSMWIDPKYNFQKEFAEVNQGYFHAEMKEIESADNINKWVEEATNGKIKDMVKAPLDPNLTAMLINAIYFKGDWQFAFNEEETDEGEFLKGDGSAVSVPFMRMKEELAYLSTDDFQAVSLPYGDGEMSMKIFLPNENSSIEEFEKMLTLENWESWNKEFTEKEGTVVFPKFELEYETQLNETLQKLGMPTVFTSQAELTKVIDDEGPFAVSEVKQKTFLEVNEKGTEAAAATSVAIVKMSLQDQPFHIEMNRPFFFTITDNDTGMNLFMGTISNPEKL